MSKDFVIRPLALVEGTPRVIAQNTSETLDPVKLTTNQNAKGVHGSFGLHMITTGAGKVDVIAETSGNGGDSFVAQPTKVVEAQATGEIHVAFTVPLSSDIRLKITETDVGQATITSLYLVLQ
jgi:hypothetical protein